MSDLSLPAMVAHRAARHPEMEAIVYRAGTTFVTLSIGEAWARVQRIAAGMLDLFAPPPGAVATIVADTSWDWIACDLALLSLGLRTAPVYASSLPPDVGWVNADAGAILAVVENAAQLEKLRSVRGGFDFFGRHIGALRVQKAVVLKPEGLAPADDWVSLAEVEAAGAAALSRLSGEVSRRTDALKRQDHATYVYTSGTTGPPKGVIQTHGNHLSILESVAELDIFDHTVRGHGTILFLPLAHSFGRLVEFGALYFLGKLILSTPATLLEDLRATRPGLLPAAPRVYEKMYAGIIGGIAASPQPRRFLAEAALAAGRAAIPWTQRGKRAPPLLALRLALLDRLVLSKLRARVGLDRARMLLSGSAPLARVVQETFLAAGLPLIEAYGLTETTPGLTAAIPSNFRVGTVGRALPGVTLRIAADGEVLARAANISPGYLNRPDADAESFDAEGYFHTGDVGELDAEGFLRITDRKKDLLKTSGGKFVAPQKIEGLLKTLPMVSDAVVVGNERPYSVALLVLDPERLAAWAARTGQPADPRSDAVRRELQVGLDRINAGLASFETVKYFRVLPEPLTVESGLITASFKVKRREVEKRFRAVIDEMYEGALLVG